MKGITGRNTTKAEPQLSRSANPVSTGRNPTVRAESQLSRSANPVSTGRNLLPFTLQRAKRVVGCQRTK
ncbi:hypothetical protein IH781_01505 [Patescibacteria group bacterium]|nr:hypothetical protein [Patescibacteria group bacterium]